MIVIQLAFICIFAFILRLMFIYIDKHINIISNGQNFISLIVMWLMIANVCIMSFIVIYNHYQSEWKLIGKVGKPGPDGPKGDIGEVGCNKNKPNTDC
jgi:hypothetical protein